jgi:hypothetical protein
MKDLGKANDPKYILQLVRNKVRTLVQFLVIRRRLGSCGPLLLTTSSTLHDLRRSLVLMTPTKPMLVIRHLSLTMANPAAFTILLTYTCSIFCHLQGVQLGAPTTFPSSRRVPILMSMDHPILSTACWHTNNQITTTLKCRHAPKKHIQKTRILCTSIFKEEGGRGSVGHSSAASEVEPSLVPQSCMNYMINIGTSIYFTKFHNHPKNLRTLECLFIRFCLAFDRGRGQRAANISRATA